MTELLLKAIDGKDQLFGRKLPHSLLSFRDHCLGYRDREPTKCPDGLEIKVLNVAYCDLFFVEDFGRLQKGIERLNRHYGSKIFRTMDEDVQRYFQNAEITSLGHASSHPFRYFHLGKKSGQYQLVRDVFLETKHFAPSSMVLAIVVYPSEEFHKQFQEIISRNSYPLVETKYTMKWGLIESSMQPAAYKRMLEIDGLFSKMNKEVIRLLKKYIGVGIWRHGLLPSIEALAINQPLGFFSQERSNIKNDSYMRESFWSGMGLGVYSSTVYTGDSFKLYLVDRESSEKIETYQILQSMPDFQCKEVGKEKEANISHHFEFLLPDISVVLAIKQFSSILEREIVLLRNRIAPFLSAQTRRGVSIKSLRGAVSRLANISGLLFQQQRLTSEMNEKFVKHVMTHDLGGITREKNSEEDKAEFYEDVLSGIERKNNFLKSQLTILKTAFQDLISYKSLRTNNIIQWVLVILTVSTIVFSFIPDEQKKKLFDYFLTLLHLK